MNVFDYFKQQLGVAPDDVTLKDLPVDSNCGQDCVAAIDAAHTLQHHAKAALGNGHDESLVELAEHVVSVYWRG